MKSVPYARLVVATWLVAAPAAVTAADALFYFVGKGEEFTQTDLNPPAPKSKNADRFHALVGPATASSLTNAMIQPPPGGMSNTLTQGPSGDWEYQASYSSLAGLDAAFPDGNYQGVIDGVHDGRQTVTLALNGNVYPSAAPHVSNFAATQALQPAYPFTLEWDSFDGGTTNDFILVTIRNGSNETVYQSPGPGQPGSLDGTATSTAFSGIPPGSLPGTIYLAAVAFGKTSARDTASYPGVQGLAVYYLETGLTLTTAANLPQARDVDSYAVSKMQGFVQTDTGPPAPDPAALFRFFAIVTPVSSSSVNNLRVKAPSGATDALTYDSSVGQFRYQPVFSSQGALDAAFGPGLYTLTLTGVHDGTRSVTLTLPVGSYPAAPRVSNFDPRQPVNSASSLGLAWDPFAGSTPADDVLLNLRDSGGNVYFAKKLHHEATNFTFSANTLRAGTNQVLLSFRTFITSDANAYPLAVGSVVYLSQTVLNVVAGLAPRLVALPPAATGRFQLQLFGQANQRYVIEASDDLKAGLWLPLTTNSSPSGQFTFADDQSTSFPARYYRARVSD